MIPTADQVALAIVEAAKVHGDDPLSIARGGAGSRGRTIAYAALIAALDGVNKSACARCVGFADSKAASGRLIYDRKRNWWSEDAVDEIVGQLVADDYEDGDEPLVEPTEPARQTRVLQFATMHFDRDERPLIAQMWNGGANPVTIGAAIGADADQIRMFAKDNPQLCVPGRGAA